jgi:hypothetical protein
VCVCASECECVGVSVRDGGCVSVSVSVCASVCECVGPHMNGLS